MVPVQKKGNWKRCDHNMRKGNGHDQKVRNLTIDNQIKLKHQK